MESSIFLQLSVVLVVAGTMAGLMRLLRQPLLVGYIITGIILGAAFLHLLGAQQSFSAFANFGVALLLFIIGLELDMQIVRRLGRVVFITLFVQMALTTLIGIVIATAFGFGGVSANLIGLALSLTSTIIIVKILIDKREHTQLYGQITIGLTLLQDVVASLALIFLTPLQNSSWLDEAFMFGKGAAVIAAIILVARFVLPKLTRFVASSQEFLFLFALAWGLGIATLFDLIGFSLAVGALLAGVSLASLPYSQEMAAKLKPLRDFFVVIFFVTLGGGLQVGHIFNALPLGLLLAFVVFAIKPIITLHVMGALAYTKRTSFKTAVTQSQISEFSLILIVLAVQRGLVPPEVVTVLTIVALTTIAASTYAMKYDDELFKWFDNHVHMFERKKIQAERSQRKAQTNYAHILFGYHKGGTEFIKTFQAMDEPFVVVDYDPEVVQLLEKENIPHKYGDAADTELLEELGIEKVTLVASTMTNFEINSGLVRYVHGANPRATIVCHADNTEQADELYTEGATYVMLPHISSSQRLSRVIKREGAHKRALVIYREKQHAEVAAGRRDAGQGGQT